MLKCLKCNRVTNDTTARFCGGCGKKFPAIERLPYIGISSDRAKFRITFAPVVAEFDHEDAAKEAARHSTWNEDLEFTGYTVERLETAVPVSEYPFVCGGCKRQVAQATNGRCGDCGERNWQKRETTPKQSAQQERKR